jgi:hypothetical protein
VHLGDLIRLGHGLVLAVSERPIIALPGGNVLIPSSPHWDVGPSSRTTRRC